MYIDDSDSFHTCVVFHPVALWVQVFPWFFLKLSVCIYKLVDAPHCDFLFFRWADCVNLCGNTAAPIKLVLGWLASTAVVRSYLCRNQGFCLFACLGQESSAYCKTGFSVRFSVCCCVEQECAFCWFLCSFLWLLCVKTVQYVHLYIVEYAENSCFVSSGCSLFVSSKLTIPTHGSTKQLNTCFKALIEK